MLKTLKIKNYALIRDLELDFGRGLTIITGETGAGKSIMLGALGLVMGGRAETKMISDDGSKSVVEALFVDVDPELKEIFDDRGIDWVEDQLGSEMRIRREISTTGRSKVFVNDVSVTLQTLSLIMPRLIDIHSQHANAKINEPSERLRIIDAMAANDKLRTEYSALFAEYIDLRRRVSERKAQIAKASENVEFLRFQLEQLDRLNPKQGELREIERRFEILSDADSIKENLSALVSLLGDGGRGVQSSLAEAVAIASKTGLSLNEETENADGSLSVVQRLRTLAIEAKDICETIEDLGSAIDTDPAALARLSERMNLYYETAKRFHVEDADDLVDIRISLRNDLDSITLGDEELPLMEKEVRRLGGCLKNCADRLTESRREAASVFASKLVETAAPLGLQNIRFVVEIKPRKLSVSGQDDVEFLCSFNKSGDLRPIGTIASGGEIARMMLSLKSILAGHINLPTIIFDEVDTGVSGEIADKMGGMMHDVAQDMQVIVITHLPQVAAKGDRHFKVYKTDADTRTETHVKALSDEERICEIASMISGSRVTDAALQAAKALLDKNMNYE